MHIFLERGKFQITIGAFEPYLNHTIGNNNSQACFWYEDFISSYVSVTRLVCYEGLVSYR